MFDSKSFGVGAQPLRTPHSPANSSAEAAQRVPRQAPSALQDAQVQPQGDRSLGLLRQLRGRWVELLGSQASSQVQLEAGAYMARIASVDQLQGRQLRLLQQMNSGRARPALGPEGKPLLHDPQAALKHLDAQIKSLSAGCTSEAKNGNSQVSRVQVQVFGSNQPMNTGTYQGVKTEPRSQRETEARGEVLAARPEAKTATKVSEATGDLRPVAQNRTTLRWNPAPPETPRAPLAEPQTGSGIPAARSKTEVSQPIPRSDTAKPSPPTPKVDALPIELPKEEAPVRETPKMEAPKPVVAPPPPKSLVEVKTPPRIPQEEVPLPLESKGEGLVGRIPAFKSLAPVTSVKVATVDSQNADGRGKYPEWLQGRVSEENSPAYLTSMPNLHRSFKPFDSKPSNGPVREPIDAMTKTDFRRADDLREQVERPALQMRSLGNPASAASGQLYQAVVSQGLLPSQRSTSESSGPKAQDSTRKAASEEEKDGVQQVKGPGRSGPAGRISGQAPIDATRGLQAALSGAAGRRDSDKTQGDMPNLAGGWTDQTSPDHQLRNGRVATTHIPMYSPILDELADRQKSTKGDTAKLQEPTSQYGGRLQEVGEDSGRGGQRGGGQQKERDQQPGGQNPQQLHEQQSQGQRKLQADQRIQLQRLEAYRIAKTDSALKNEMRSQQTPQGQQLGELVARNAGHSMESLLKKAYRLDSLKELSKDEAVNCLGLVLKLGGEFTFAHSARVLELAMDLADEVGIKDEKTREQVRLGALLKDTGEMALMLDSAPEEKLELMGEWLGSQDLRRAGLLHDIGKIKVPNEILYKPGKLTDEEYEIIKMHPIFGEQIVYPIQTLRHLCPAIRGHHERWDGKGYPDGLAGEAIPLPARIIAVADVFDALAAERPYKAGMPVEKVQAILREGRGSHFDPDLADAFERVLQRRYPELENPFA